MASRGTGKVKSPSGHLWIDPRSKNRALGAPSAQAGETETEQAETEQ